jgi:hypothetical protein
MNSDSPTFGSSCSTQLHLPLERSCLRVQDLVTPVPIGSMAQICFDYRRLQKFSTLLHWLPPKCRIFRHVSPNDKRLRSSPLLRASGILEVPHFKSSGVNDQLSRVLLCQRLGFTSALRAFRSFSHSSIEISRSAAAPDFTIY